MMASSWNMYFIITIIIITFLTSDSTWDDNPDKPVSAGRPVSKVSH